MVICTIFKSINVVEIMKTHITCLVNVTNIHTFILPNYQSILRIGYVLRYLRIPLHTSSFCEKDPGYQSIFSQPQLTEGKEAFLLLF